MSWNATVPVLYEEALRRGEGRLAEGGAFVVQTGQHTGRAPNDKFIVWEPSSAERIWWGKVNRPVESDRFAALHRRVLAYLDGKECFAQDCYVGADPSTSSMDGVTPDVIGGEAVAKCPEGDAKASIPTLERLLKDADMTLPPRS